MEIIVRATVIYFFIWVVSRSTGKRQFSEMTAFELMLLVTVGDLVQQGVTQDDTSLTGAALAVSTLAFWVIVFSYVSWRFKRTRPLVEGSPVVVVRHGQPVERVMRMERLALGELKEEARGQGISDLGEVDIAVLEPDGTFSFIKRQRDQHDARQKHSAT